VTTLRHGDRLVLIAAGGGGYGDPFARDPVLVAADVRDGKVSVEAAASSYGVVVDPRTGMVDQAATERLRVP